jgi:two-component system LytT family response regulator
MMMNCIIIDDEKPAMSLMVDNVGKIPYLNMKGCCKNAFEAGEMLMKEKIDLVFLDIQMPVVSGLQFLKTLVNPPMVIFTTAYEQYALEGFELNVIDYLMKPFSFDRFLKAVTKAQEQFNFRNTNATKVQEAGFFFVHSEYKELKILYRDVLYVEGLKDYVKIYLANTQYPILTRLNLKGMEARLPLWMFHRIHNSFIVNITKITSTQKAQVFIEQKSIPIGASFADDFFIKYKGS